MIARLRARLSESGGYTLSEMIVVLAILGIVVGALAQLFVSASNAQVDMNNRFQAQQNARLAVDKLRREIHCASAVTNTPPPPPWPPTVWPPPWSPPTTPTSSITIGLGSYCPTNATGGVAAVTWCTKAEAGSTPALPRYALWRYGGTTCSGTGQKWADYLVVDQVFTNYASPTSGTLGTLHVNLPVDLSPGNAQQRYRLEDDIVLRNTTRP